MKLKLGINNCFLARMYASTPDWLEIIAGKMDCDLVQYSWDMLDLSTPDDTAHEICADIKDSAGDNNIKIDTTLTGNSPLIYNFLLHPDSRMREAACTWFLKMIELTKMMGARATGGHLGTFSANDVGDMARREEIESDLQIKLDKMTKSATDNNLEFLMVLTSPNPHFLPNEPEHALKWAEVTNRNMQLPVFICLDTSHIVKYRGPDNFEKDFYGALEMLAPVSPVINLKQTDGTPGNYWPFTDEYNQKGVIDGTRIIETLERGGAKDVTLVVDPVWVAKKPPSSEFIGEVADSVKYWKEYV